MTVPKVPFSAFKFSPEIKAQLQKRGFEFASEIQQKSIPVILEQHHDIVGIAQTGTGKTAAFGLPIIEKINQDYPGIKALVLTPTRELALQVAKELELFQGAKNLRMTAVYGGAPMTQQIQSLKRGSDIVVGTPGRVMDLLQRGILKLDDLQFFVLDEADEMLKMGFIEDIETILQNSSPDKRVFLYSATMPERIQNLSKKYMKSQVVLKVQATDVRRDNIQQFYFKTRRQYRLEAIKNIIEAADNFHGIVFCQTKALVNELTDKLKADKVLADCVHGDIDQSGREKILKKFQDRKLQVLIATDVAARGIHVEDLTHVINYSIPREIDSYVHRIGRTGRAGKPGIAMSFIEPREEYVINRLRKETKNHIEEGTLPSPELVESKKRKKIITELERLIADEDIFAYAELSKKLVQNHSATEVISALFYYINGSGKAPAIPRETFEHKPYAASSNRSERRNRANTGGKKPHRGQGRKERDRNFKSRGPKKGGKRK